MARRAAPGSYHRRRRGDWISDVDVDPQRLPGPVNAGGHGDPDGRVQVLFADHLWSSSVRRRIRRRHQPRPAVISRISAATAAGSIGGGLGEQVDVAGGAPPSER